ncbi:MAG: response regulator transcription factor [Deltaproteobacteria bacterium]|nr:response regulator transcription factor [Myxococcales bacterium]MDP3212924.1 response regulator transcription factor [Deltaproteobacteria bacterium]
MTRVFVADDHTIVCEGLQRWSETVPGLTWAGSTGEWRTLLRRAAEEEWDVLVLDLSLPERSGTELLREVLALRPALRVVIYSMYRAEDYAAWALAAGASAFVSKSEPLQALRDALLGAASEATPGDPVPLPHERLSARETEVFLAIARGRTPSEVAWDLEMAPSTVSTHLKAIREKLGARSVPEIAQYATRHGITGTPA